MKMNNNMIIAVASFVLLVSCSGGVKPINYGKDNCDFCKMTIVDNKFAVEIITAKGKIYKVDDLICARGFIKEGSVAQNEIAEIYVNDFNRDGALISLKTATLVASESLQSPMGGNVASFKSEQEAKKFIDKKKGEIVPATNFTNPE